MADVMEQLAARGVNLALLAELEWPELNEALKSHGVLKLGHRLQVSKLLRQPGAAPLPAALPPAATPPPLAAAAKEAAEGALPDRTRDRAVPHDLSAAACEALLRELLAQYAQPAFAAELRQALASAGGGLKARIGEVVLRVQAPLLLKCAAWWRYGLPPSFEGVDVMKYSIHRRIAEGPAHVAERLQSLANEARKALFIAPIPDHRSTSAEQKLQGMLHEGSAGVTYAAMEAALRRAVDGRRLSHANERQLHRLLQERVVEPLIFRSMLSMAEAGLPASSLLGGDRAEELSHVPVLSRLPSAASFMAEHVLPNRPCVLRGLLTAERWSPLGKLPDFAYLRARCAHRRVACKSLALDDRDGRPVFVSDPELKLPMVDFLDAVEQSERDGSRCPFYLGKVPLRAELPELLRDIEAEAADFPITKLQECFGALTPAGVFTYFGCDRNVTATHFDRLENLLVCICGTKRLWLYPPSHTQYLYPIPSLDASRSAAPPFQTYDSLSPTQREEYPALAGARAVEVYLEAGDILYLPSCWWHCVEGSRERNMILNWWFELHPSKREHAT